MRFLIHLVAESEAGQRVQEIETVNAASVNKGRKAVCFKILFQTTREFLFATMDMRYKSRQRWRVWS
jgi:hypothetical protein